MTDEAPTVDEIWYYSGRRIDTHGRAFCCWIDATGQPHDFRRLRANLVGGGYRVGVQRPSDGRVLVAGAPSYCPDLPAHPQAANWQVEDLAVQVQQEQRRREKEAKNDDALIGAVRFLAKRHDSIRTRAGRAAFLAWLIEEVTGQ